jgi:hypothetical protein
VVSFNRHGTVLIVEDRLTVACDLATALDAGEVEDFREFSEDYEELPRGAHAWPEIQTVVAAHRSGMPVLWRRSSREDGRKTRRDRSNMYEPDISSGEDGIDVTTFSYAQVHVSRAVRDAFEGDELELRILLGCAVRHGSYKPGRGDSHIVSYDGHSFVLTPDASAVIGYRFFKPRTKQRRTGDEVETVSLEESGFDPSKVDISERVLDSFSNKHGTDEDEAEEEIRDFIADAIERDRHKVAKNGCHVFDVDGYTVWVSPDARRVTKYETRHIERTPRDVREGVPSRFSKPRERNREEAL